MVTTTVSQSDTRAAAAPVRRTGGGVARSRFEFGYLCAAALSLVTAAMMVRTWVTVSGPDGTVGGTATGRIIGIPDGYDFVRDDDGPVTLSSFWSTLVFVSAAAVVVSMLLFFRRRYFALRTEMPANALVVAAAVMVISVVCEVLYLHGKISQLDTLVQPHGFFDAVDGIFRDLVHDNSDTTAEQHPLHAHFDRPATIAVAASCIAMLYAGMTRLCRLRLELLRRVPGRSVAPTAIYPTVAQPVHVARRPAV